MEKKYWVAKRALGGVGLLLLLASLLLILTHSYHGWYLMFVVGLTFLLGFVNDYKGRRSFYHWLFYDRLRFFTSYIYYFMVGVLIELVGRLFLGLWEYVTFDELFFVIYVFLIGYPFALFAVYETYCLINQFMGKYEAIVVTTIVSAFLHEIPNTWMTSWFYIIPLVSLKILQINVVVICGWVILVLAAIKEEAWRLIF